MNQLDQQPYPDGPDVGTADRPRGHGIGSRDVPGRDLVPGSIGKVV